MNATFYSNFSKKINSTKRPSGGDTKSVRLKETCPLLNPVFLLNTVNYSYNYVHWEGRYYWITDIVAVANGVGEYHCTVDVLASWKSYIGNTNAYVLRSASQHKGKILDNLYPTDGNVTVIKNTTKLSDDLVVANPSQGTYVIGIVNRGGSVGAVSYYALNKTQFSSLMDFMLSSPVDNYGIDVDEISDSLFKAVFNPAQYIVSAMWLPIARGALDLEAVSSIDFGWWSYSMVCSKINNPKWYDIGTITIPAHPLELTRGEYLNYHPYSSYYMYNTMFGLIPLDPTDLVGENRAVSYRIDIDCITGEAILEVYYANTILTSKRAKIGVPIQLGQLSTSAQGLVSTAGNIAGIGASIATGNVLGAIGSTIGAIGSIGSWEKTSTAGNNGTFIGIDTNLYLIGKFLGVVSADNEHKGRPLCENKTLSTLSGYILCSDGEVEAPATADELNSIKSYLEGGFFYE